MSGVYRFGSLLLVFGGWCVLTDGIDILDPAAIPAFSSVVKELTGLFQEGVIFQDIQETFLRWLIGFAIGVSSGIAVGFFLAASYRAYRLMELPIELLRSIPVTAMLPLFFLLFGVGDNGKIAMVVLPTFLLMVVNTRHGALACDPEQMRMARLFGATNLQMFYRITWYETLPYIFIGLRIALSLSLMVSVVSEMFIGTNWGLGQRIYDAYLKNAPTYLYAFLLIIGFYAYSLNALLMWMERIFVTWRGKNHEAG